MPKILKGGKTLTSEPVIAEVIYTNQLINQNEVIRQTDEINRNNAEIARQTSTATAISNANNAATNANNKATLANTATTNANNATAIFTQETIKIYKPSVATYADIATTYPTPQNGWDTVTLDTSIEWRYNGTTSTWVNIGIKSQVDVATDISNGIVKGGGNVEIALDGTLSVPDVGDLTLLNTTSNTDLVGAINEINAKPSVSDASDVTYNNETSGLNSNKVQGAIDEVTSQLADYASLFTTNPDAKNSIYRGSYLGSSVTASQYTAISSGTFTDLYIGDYWTIGGVNYRIAAFNYYTNTGDISVPPNHITIVPDTQLYTHVMNDTDITTGGYTGSKMYTEGLEQAKSTIRGIFGTHLVKHRQIYSNATVDGKASGWAWVDSEVDLMSEIMVYGSVVWGESTIGGSGYNIGVGKSQLPLFRLNPRMINTRQTYWLRDVVSASDFARVNDYGFASYLSASYARGVRPAFSIS